MNIFCVHNGTMVARCITHKQPGLVKKMFFCIICFPLNVFFVFFIKTGGFKNAKFSLGAWLYYLRKRKFLVGENMFFFVLIVFPSTKKMFFFLNSRMVFFFLQTQSYTRTRRCQAMKHIKENK